MPSIAWDQALARSRALRGQDARAVLVLVSVMAVGVDLVTRSGAPSKQDSVVSSHRPFGMGIALYPSGFFGDSVG